MDFGGTRKRGTYGSTINGDGCLKKIKQEMESNQSGVAIKSKPCTKFFSTSGCPFGEGCHFLHYVPGGYKAVANILNPGNNPNSLVGTRSQVGPPSFPDGSNPSALKTRLCNKYNTVEGCKFGDKCHFAHGEWELVKPNPQMYDELRSLSSISGRISRSMDNPPQSLGSSSTFGVSATAKISIDASLAGAIIGKNGANSKQIRRVTGAKVSVRDHETDPNLKNIELDGTFDQMKEAGAMVQELLLNVGQSSRSQMRNSGHGFGLGPGSNYKTKLCENYGKGSCTFGERCHFAHGEEELRNL